jgi:aspartyl-tRNA(Asn)/glutamyl-tRNA(Gln) amidotransferase subunit B
LNQKVVEYAIKAGLALGCKVAPHSFMARKNYFYPDLPKGYQISQSTQPICQDGFIQIELPEGSQKIEIERIHIEEDAGKNMHFENFSLINLNRAGVPLIEIVSRPQMHSAKQASQYLKALHAILVALGITHGNLQEGNFRCDVNISVKPPEQKELGVRAEIKNVNSFRFVEKAIEFEVKRQSELLLSGGVVHQETRTFDPATHTTLLLRKKEDAQDYRYFAEPDLFALQVPSQWIEQVRLSLPELPEQKKQRFMTQFELSAYDAAVMASEKSVTDLFEQTLQLTSQALSHSSLKSCAKVVANLISAEPLRLQNEKDQSIADSGLSSQHLSDLTAMLLDGEISANAAKLIIAALWDADQMLTVRKWVEKLGLGQLSDEAAIEKLAKQVVENNPTQVAQYQSGKTKVFGFFVGQTMKLSQTPLNGAVLTKVLERLLTKG